MVIESVVFRTFYMVLCETVVKNYYKGDRRKFKVVTSRNIWKLFDEADYKKIFGGGLAQSTEYFYRKNSELNPSAKSVGEVEDIAMIKAFEYINVKPRVPDTDFNKMNYKTKSETLRDVFIQDYHTEIEKTRRELINTQDDNLVYAAIENFVRIYFKTTSEHKHEDGWKLLSSGYRTKRWKDIQKFYDVFQSDLIVIKEIIVFDYKKRKENSISCKVFVRYNNLALTSEHLMAFNKLTMENLDQFKKISIKLGDELELGGFTAIGDLAVSKLYEIAEKNQEYRTREIVQKDYDYLHYRQFILENSLIEFICIYEDDQWLVADIIEYIGRLINTPDRRNS